jgi:hypothetical protein
MDTRFCAGEVAPTVPAIVAKWLARTIPEGSKMIKAAKVYQRGQFLLGKTYSPFEATEDFTAAPMSFKWHASIRAFSPFVSIHVNDSYTMHHGKVDAKLFGLFPVAHQEGPGVDESAFGRFVAEAIWMPTSLLPAAHVLWLPGPNDTSARLEMSDGELKAEAFIEFAESGQLRTLSMVRKRDCGHGKIEPCNWFVRFDEEKVFHGFIIPAYAEVSWKLDDGLQTYYKGFVDQIDFTYDS